MVIGRTIQGAASGALLPVTLALAADLWSARNRATVLGGIGAAQELGSVLGPLYGVAVVVYALNTWRDVFWINVPLAILAIVMVHFSLPSKDARTALREKVDVVGRSAARPGALGLMVFGHVQPGAGWQDRCSPAGVCRCLVAALVVAIAFFGWEKFARTRLIDPTGVRFGPFLAALGASLCAGAALMVTLVNVELFGQGVLGKEQNETALPPVCGSWAHSPSAPSSAAGSPPGLATASWRSSAFSIAAFALLAGITLGGRRPVRPPRPRVSFTLPTFADRSGAGRVWVSAW